MSVDDLSSLSLFMKSKCQLMQLIYGFLVRLLITTFEQTWRQLLPPVLPVLGCRVVYLLTQLKVGGANFVTRFYDVLLYYLL